MNSRYDKDTPSKMSMLHEPSSVKLPELEDL